MIGAYFALLVAAGSTPRPEDDPTARSTRAPANRACSRPGAGGRLVARPSAAAITFPGLAVGWWMSYIGLVLGILGLVGWVFEFYRGEHAH